MLATTTSEQRCMTTHDEKIAIAKRFHGALVKKDWDSMRDIITADATWVLPGNNRISGPAHGVEAIIERARLIASFGLSFALEHVLVSRDHMALALHNTARRGELVLDEKLATVCHLKNGRITNIETFLSDLDGMNAFFA